MSWFRKHNASWQPKREILLSEAEWLIMRKYYYYLDPILL